MRTNLVGKEEAGTLAGLRLQDPNFEDNASHTPIPN